MVNVYNRRVYFSKLAALIAGLGILGLISVLFRL